MADTVRRVQYFYTEVADKPGEGAKLLSIKEVRVELLAFSGLGCQPYPRKQTTLGGAAR